MIDKVGGSVRNFGILVVVHAALQARLLLHCAQIGGDSTRGSRSNRLFLLVGMIRMVVVVTVLVHDCEDSRGCVVDFTGDLTGK